MENAIPILLLCMAGGLLLYGGLLAATGDITMLRRRYRQSAKMKNEKAYARRLGLIILLCAAPFAVSGLIGLWLHGAHLWIPLLVLVAGLVAAIWFGARWTKREEDWDS